MLNSSSIARVKPLIHKTFQRSLWTRKNSNLRAFYARESFVQNKTYVLNEIILAILYEEFMKQFQTIIYMPLHAK